MESAAGVSAGRQKLRRRGRHNGYQRLLRFWIQCVTIFQIKLQCQVHEQNRQANSRTGFETPFLILIGRRPAIASLPAEAITAT